jgi:hypothetical protein
LRPALPAFHERPPNFRHIQAFTGTGFTISGAEKSFSHPLRRRIINEQTLPTPAVKEMQSFKAENTILTLLSSARFFKIMQVLSIQ